MQNFPGACPLTPLEARAFGTINYSLFSIAWGWNLWNCKSLTSSQSSLGQTFAEGINHSQTVVTGREGYHKTSNTEDSNNVFALSTESARDVFKMSH